MIIPGDCPATYKPDAGTMFKKWIVTGNTAMNTFLD
jgi:hypothetical protein